MLWYCNALNHLAPSPIAFQEWKKSSFAQRRMLLKILLKFTVENQADICRCLDERGRGLDGVESK